MHKHTGENTTPALGWTLGAHRGFSGVPPLIKFTVLLLVRFSRKNKHFPTTAGLEEGGGGWLGWHTLKLRCGGGVASVEQLSFIKEGDFAEACFTPDKVKVDKPKIIQ